MIVELSVENLAIIERSDLSFGPGFTVLTGETGAGKSLIVDALELAFGARADSELVRSGAPRALVSVTIDLSHRPELVERCLEMGAELSEGMLYIQREVFAEGRSQCRIGGRLVPVSMLKDVGGLLVDLHGQHDHQSLLDPRTHIGFLDAWIGKKLGTVKAKVRKAAEKSAELDARLQAIRGNRRDREQRIDLLRYQVGEIEMANLRVGELQALEARLARLKHAEQLSQTAAFVKSRLIEGDSAGRDALSSAARALEEGKRLDPTLERLQGLLDQATILVDEALAELSAYQDTIESSPQQLEDTAERIDGLKRVLRKYGDDEAAVLEFLEKARAELELLTGDEVDEASLEADCQKARMALIDACLNLTSVRREGSSAFDDAVEGHLRDLDMTRAQFSTQFHSKEPDETGGDLVEYLFSANAGEDMRPLSKIASGGEISRVMLAIKTALMGKAGVPTLIFDEVDAGLGGRAAASVAKKLDELARHDQVLVITHLPQIAGMATAHFRVEKVESSGRSVAVARPLNSGQRVEEIARMLAGEEVGASAIQHAEELLGMGRKPNSTG